MLCACTAQRVVILQSWGDESSLYKCTHVLDVRGGKCIISMKFLFNFYALNQQKLKGSSVKPIWDCHIVKEFIEWMLKQQWQGLIADENGLTLKKSN